MYNYIKYIALFPFLCLISCNSGRYDLNSYTGQLQLLREKCQEYDLDAPRFFLFGMGNRDKFVYENYRLKDALSGSVVLDFGNAVSDSIIPSDYKVIIKQSNETIIIYEDSDGIWLQNGNRRDSIHTKCCHIELPEFDTKLYGKILKVLHQEILFNIKDSRIYPNLFVYKEPFLRDAFMGALCLEMTGNIKLIQEWICNIDSIYDMQNNEAEPDNLGELLYLLSFVPEDANHGLRHQLMNEIARQTICEDNLKYISGHTDGNDNAEYQTQILKYALRKNNMKDDYTSAPNPGFYHNLCWFSKSGNNHQSIRQRFDDWLYRDRDLAWPYLKWARAHFYGNMAHAPVSVQDYPLSWEKWGESAIYDGMNVISEKAFKNQICYPHVWTAAEMFLKLIEYEK